MYIREAKPADFPDVGEIQAECNKTDSLARHFIRNIDKYPTTYRWGSILFVKRRGNAPGTVTFVVETEPSDYPINERHKAPEIVGFSMWHRLGSSPKAKEWQKYNSGWYSSLNRVLDSVEDQYLRIFTRVQCTFHRDHFQEIAPTLMLPFDPELFMEAWHLELFFVRPDWQRRGMGRKLLQWGFDRANEEQVPIIVKSSPKGAPAYRATGFQSYGEVGLNKFFDTLEFGGEEPQMWVWEPNGSEGKYTDKARAQFQKAFAELQAASERKTLTS